MSSEFGPRVPPDSDDFRRAVAAQSVAADPLASAWVAANAGSGKTKVLIDRVARLLLRKAAPDSILCITYTRAAANEMMSRLFRRLGDWSVMEDDALRDKLAALEGRRAGEFTAGDLAHARALFARALETPGGLRIETIHAFCARLLRRFPLEAGVAPGFRDLEEDEATRLWKGAMDAALLEARNAAPDALDGLAIEGGGNGARVPLSRLRGRAELVRAFAEAHGHDRESMAFALRRALGAPDASVAELTQRAMGDDFPETDLRAALASLRHCGKRDSARTANAIEAALQESDPQARWAAYRNGFLSPSSSRPYKTFANAEALKDPLVNELFATRTGEGREVTRVLTFDRDRKAAEAVERNLSLLTVGLPLLSHFTTAKSRRAALDFDDLIRSARSLLTRSTLADWVLYKLDGGISHVLLDEAQDTSPDQWEVIGALTDEFAAGAGAEREPEPRTLFVVGDEKQSIYSFQGAAPERFLSGRRQFSAHWPDARTPDMEMSFRSSPQVLEFVDEVFNTDVFDGDPFALEPPPEADRVHHAARRANQSGRVEIWPLVEAGEAREADPWDAPVDALSESSPRARLARDVARAVRAMIDAGETVWAEDAQGRWCRRAVTPGDVLILVRSRTGGLFDGLILSLKQEGLPVAGADRLVPTDHLGVQDCLNLIRFALFPRDDLALAEILRGPFCGLVDDDQHLFPLAFDRGRHALWTRLQASDDPRHDAARAFLEELVSSRDLPPFEFLSRALDTPGPGGETGWQRLIARLGPPVRDPVEALLSRALAHDTGDAASLQTFLSAMETDTTQIKRDLAEADGAVRVMTVHGAKGLQAPVVILPDTVAGPRPVRDGLFDLEGVPVWATARDRDTGALESARQRAADKDLREHRRLLYVALTRAQDRLVIAGAALGNQSGGHHDASWYALCRSAAGRLGAEEQASGILAHGDPPPVLDTPGQIGGEADAPAPGWLSKPARLEGAARRSLSPSEIGHDGGPVLAPGDAGRKWRLRRGRLIHELLERLAHLPAGSRSAAARDYLARQPDLEAGRRDEIAETVRATLADPGMARIFSPAGRSEVAIVGRGTGWPEGRFINGRVDRLVVSDEEVLIADIKTDRPAPDDESGVEPAYFEQMAAYANVLEAAWPGRETRCAIVWTDGPRLMFLSPERLLEALNRAQSRL